VHTDTMEAFNMEEAHVPGQCVVAQMPMVSAMLVGWDAEEEGQEV